MACRSQTIEPCGLWVPGVDYGYGGPGSTMAAPAEPTTLSQRAGRRHSLGMHGRPKPTWLVTWCHIIAQTLNGRPEKLYQLLQSQ